MRSSPAVVGSAVPVAVLAVPVRVLAVHWVRGPWRLWAPDTVLVISLDVGESLQIAGEERGKALRWSRVCWTAILCEARCSGSCSWTWCVGNRNSTFSLSQFTLITFLKGVSKSHFLRRHPAGGIRNSEGKGKKTDEKRSIFKTVFAEWALFFISTLKAWLRPVLWYNETELRVRKQQEQLTKTLDSNYILIRGRKAQQQCFKCNKYTSAIISN